VSSVWRTNSCGEEAERGLFGTVAECLKSAGYNIIETASGIGD
jgi:hypothetical protein